MSELISFKTITSITFDTLEVEVEGLGTARVRELSGDIAQQVFQLLGTNKTAEGFRLAILHGMVDQNNKPVFISEQQGTEAIKKHMKFAHINQIASAIIKLTSGQEDVDGEEEKK